MAEELESLDGIGPKTRDQLESMGISSIQDLAKADPSVVEDHDVSISVDRMEGYIDTAGKQGIIIQSGAEVVEEYESRVSISTGVDRLDEATNGGFENGTIVAIGGDSGSGKTQMAFQALGNAVQETGNPAVYIETEPDRYQGKRIRDMFDKETQEKVFKVPVRGEDALDQQRQAYDAVREQFDDLSMVVVDSFTSRFRLSDRFGDRSSYNERSEEFKAHLNAVEQLAIDMNCPVLLICQIYTDPDGWGKDLVIYGSNLMMHMVGFVIMLQDYGGALSNLEVRNHPNQGDSEFEIQIVEGGVQIPD